MRNVWFHRDYARFQGGHLKHSHYFGHVAAMPGFAPKITFSGNLTSEDLTLERQQLWPPTQEFAAAHWRPGEGDLFFLAGVDWRYLFAGGFEDFSVPRINLVQGIRHAQADTELYRYLAHKAVRVCVSEEVADAILSTGRVNGPVMTIRNSIDIDPIDVGVGSENERKKLRPVVVVGYKRPQLADGLASQLSVAGIEHLVVKRMRDRSEFLALLAESRVAVCLPLVEEGFYLPALEAMAMGCVVVTLDCVGNRSFCHHAENCLIAEPNERSLATATSHALQLSVAERSKLLQHAVSTAGEHTLSAERTRFHEVLADIDRIWASG